MPAEDDRALAALTTAAEPATENSIAGPVRAAVIVAAGALASFFDK